MKDPEATFPLVTVKGFPHGVRCQGCGRIIPDGTPYSVRLASMVGETPVCDLVCVYCTHEPDAP